MNKIYKAHPLMVVSLMKPFLFVLLFPVIKGVIHYLTDRTVTGVIIFEILLFFIIALIAFFRWRAFRLIIDNDDISLKTGFIFVKRATIKITQLSSVESRQNPFDAVFHSVSYSINTEAGRKNTPDFTDFQNHLNRF